MNPSPLVSSFLRVEKPRHYATPRWTAAEIHAALAGRWPETLAALGISSEALRNRHGPCPACGGTDRFRFDDRHQRGGFYCNSCGAGDGFKLLQNVHGWSFAEARRAVLDVAGLAPVSTVADIPPRPMPAPAPEITRPPARVRTLLRTSTTPDSVPDVTAYLRSRALWPLPAGCAWRAHVGVDYFTPAHREAVALLGRFPALVAPVVDIDGETVTAHVTYLQDGRKLAAHEPRKLLSGMGGRRGCAVRLFPLAGDVLGIAEGCETAIAASILHDGLPVWAALNTSLLAKFEPPPEIRRVLIVADRDVAGLEAAWKLRDALDGRCVVKLCTPQAPANDWADVLEARS